MTYDLCKSTLDPQVQARLEVEAIPVQVFSRGTWAAAARGGWRKEATNVTMTAEGWTFWASAVAVASQQRREELTLRLSCLRLSADGVDPSDSYSREAAYGPAGKRRRMRTRALRHTHAQAQAHAHPAVSFIVPPGPGRPPAALYTMRHIRPPVSPGLYLNPEKQNPHVVQSEN